MTPSIPSSPREPGAPDVKVHKLLTGQKALVTGANSGIGCGVALALGQAGAAEPKSWDPRLSARGNRLSKQLAVLLDRLAEMENFLECHGWTSLAAADHLVLGPIFQRLSRDAKCVADGAADLAVEMQPR